jgi:hypothetical protein
MAHFRKSNHQQAISEIESVVRQTGDARFGQVVRRMNLPWPLTVPSRASQPNLTQR